VHNEIASSNVLIANLLVGHGKAIFPAIPSQGYLPVTKAGDNLVVVANGAIHLPKKMLKRDDTPALWHFW